MKTSQELKPFKSVLNLFIFTINAKRAILLKTICLSTFEFILNKLCILLTRKAHGVKMAFNPMKYGVGPC